MNAKQVDEIARLMVPGLKVLRDQLREEIRDAVSALRAELQGSQKAAPRFCGPWRDGQAYDVGDLVIRGGSTWVAAHPAAPGACPGLQGDEDAGPWRLAAARGRPGKDGAMTPELERRLRSLEAKL